MATIVYQQNSQPSCLDSQLVEPRTTLRLKLSSPLLHQQQQQLLFKPTFSQTEQSQKCHYNNTNNNNNNSDQGMAKGGWSFLQSLSNATQTKEATHYVHPLSRRAPGTILSERSLALCTENLGNESGTTETAADCAALWGADAAAAGASGGEGEARRRPAARAPRAAARSFPPPLTTMSGREELRVRPHREGGRLIIEAVKAPRPSSCFVADRSEGRLRLRLLERFESGEEVERESLEKDTKEEEEEETTEVGVDDAEELLGVGESEKEKGEVGRIEKFGRARGGRCKEGGEQYIVENKSMLKPFWVAT